MLNFFRAFMRTNEHIGDGEREIDANTAYEYFFFRVYLDEKCWHINFIIDEKIKKKVERRKMKTYTKWGLLEQKLDMKACC